MRLRVAQRLIFLIAPFVVCGQTYADQTDSIVVHSIVASSAQPGKAPEAQTSINVCFDYSYDGSLGPLSFHALAVSGIDWEIGSVGSGTQHSEVGSHRSADIQITHPVETSEIRTNKVVIVAYSASYADSIVYVKALDYPIQWAKTEALDTYANYKTQAILNYYLARDYQTIDDIVTYWIEEDRFDQHGDSRITQLYSDLLLPFNAHRSSSLANIRAWRNKNPHSRAAALIEASYWVSYASDLLGYIEPGRTPDEELLKVIRYYHANALKVLDESKSTTGKTPLWHWLRLKIAIDGYHSEKEINSTFEDGFRAFPRHQPLYFLMGAHIAKDGGKDRWTKFNNLADRLELASHDTAPGAYARLMSETYKHISGYLRDFYTTGIVSWPRVRDSWQALVKQYPTLYNLNRFAASACQAGDKEVFGTLIGRLGKRINPDLWPTNNSVDLCKSRFMLQI